jgi:hypothetical protein
MKQQLLKRSEKRLIRPKRKLIKQSELRLPKKQKLMRAN